MNNCEKTPKKVDAERDCGVGWAGLGLWNWSGCDAINLEGDIVYHFREK